MSHTLKLDIVTQERRLLTVETKQLTVETTSGEITILPDHIPLVTKLTEGLLQYLDDKGKTEIVAIFGGFLELDSNNKCSILADSAVRADDIDLAKVKQAQEDAKKALKDKSSERDFVLAEAALRNAALELKAAERHNRHRTS